MSARPIYLFALGPLRNILMGGGLAYSIQQKTYDHIPLIVIFPSVYAGYQAFANKDNIVEWIREKTVKLK
jgi:hypothetical protein